MRLVSLVPSLTDMVCAFGLRPALVGCTKFCIRPSGLRKTATLIGGTKDPDLGKVRALAPTHILVNEEENKPEHIAACKEIAPTFVSFPKGPEDGPALLRAAGTWLGCAGEGETWARDVEARLEALSAPTERKRALYFIWREPYMIAARDTYIDGMLSLLGFDNAAPLDRGRYPEMTLEQIKAARADVLLLSTEPYPFRVRDAERLRSEWPEVPAMWKADGQLFSWYGTLQVEALDEMLAWRRGKTQRLFEAMR